MQSLNALSLAPAVTRWLANTRQPRILHVFEHACNLINERREVLSIVTPEIGNGPFNLVVDTDVLFHNHLCLETPISTFPDLLNFGDLTVHIPEAQLWNPCPDWGRLHAKKYDIATHLTELPVPNDRTCGAGMDFFVVQPYRTSTQSPVANLCLAVAKADIPSAREPASQLAGLGPGLTPAGDDFIMGVTYAAWIVHPSEGANTLAGDIASTAALLTTSLSAAWLSAAGRGEAGFPWHQFFEALLSGEQAQTREAVARILATGATSGPAALNGFVFTMLAWTTIEY